MLKTKAILGAALVVALAGAAQAQYTFPSFNSTDFRARETNAWTGIDLNSLAGAALPNNTYVSYTVSLNWNSNVGGTSSSLGWSSEARIAMGNAAATGTTTTPTPAGATFYRAVQSPTTGSGSNANNTTLTFTGSFTNAFTYSGSESFFFNWRQSFNPPVSQNITWSNVTVTLNPLTVPTPSYDFGTLGQLGSPVCAPAVTLAAGQVVWYTFTLSQAWNSADIFTTLGAGVTDTEIGLYNSAGTLLGSDDDYSGSGGLGSRIGVGGGTGYEYDGPGPIPAFGAADQGSPAGPASLAAGTYYVALAGYNSTFGNFFGVTPGSASGSTELCIIPTPSALALLGLGGLAAMRRRR